MKQRAIWFVLGVTAASIFWIAVINRIGIQWLDKLLMPT